jgi:hypothetical protein
MVAIAPVAAIPLRKPRRLMRAPDFFSSLDMFPSSYAGIVRKNIYLSM